MGAVSALAPYGRGVIGPRTSALRHLLGEDVPDSDVLCDMSEYGLWRDGGPLDTRPPELWADKIHDHVGGDW